MLLDGKKLALGIYDVLKEKIHKQNRKITLGAILIGNSEASLRYIKQKRKWAQYIGINFELNHLNENLSEEELLLEINKFNNRIDISGFIVQLPLPDHINTKKIIESISPKKDVDGFHPENQGKILIGDNSGLVPCTPAGIMEFFKQENIEYAGKNIVVIGRSNIVGKPITALLINAGATVTSCNSKTKNLESYTKKADIIIAAAGKPGLLKVDMIKKESIIIDVGFSVIDGRIYGDCDTTHIDKLGAKITPVPGGVGALTVCMLMKNTLKAAGIIS